TPRGRSWSRRTRGTCGQRRGPGCAPRTCRGRAATRHGTTTRSTCTPATWRTCTPGCWRRPRTGGSADGGAQRPVEVGPQVLDVLDAHGHAQQVLGHGARLGGEPAPPLQRGLHAPE